ncbi:membrane protein [Streptomyces sp. NRRL B-1568]|nr:membrane protein [Streptomyces sp. NRRL B-1568]
MDIKTADSLRRLRLVSVPEAVSWLLLICCIVLKNTTSFNAVPVMGWVHGISFILYVVFLADAWNRTKWPWTRAALYFALSIIPTGGFFADRMLRREAEATVIAARARKESVVNA